MAGKSPGNEVVSGGACESRQFKKKNRKTVIKLQGQYYGETYTNRTMAKGTLALIQETALE